MSQESRTFTNLPKDQSLVSSISVRQLTNTLPQAPGESDTAFSLDAL